MIGPRYWSTGISLKSVFEDRYSLSLEFFDDGWLQSRSTEGVMRARYPARTIDETVSQALTLKADSERLGIEWRSIDGPRIWTSDADDRLKVVAKRIADAFGWKV